MSELKAFNCVDSDLQEFCEPRLVYIKSEADKVIAELEESHKKEVGQLLIEIVKLKEHVKSLVLDNYLKDKEIRRQKYRRCLAMASRCDEAYRRECYLNPEQMTNEEFYKQQIEFWPRWSFKWLAIAEKFKEVK